MMEQLQIMGHFTTITREQLQIIGLLIIQPIYIMEPAHVVQELLLE